MSTSKQARAVMVMFPYASFLCAHRILCKKNTTCINANATEMHLLHHHSIFIHKNCTASAPFHMFSCMILRMLKPPAPCRAFVSYLSYTHLAFDRLNCYKLVSTLGLCTCGRIEVENGAYQSQLHYTSYSAMTFVVPFIR